MSAAPHYFADTAFWLALFSRRDALHARAIAWQQLLLSQQARLLTTEPVLWEWLNALSAPGTRARALAGYQRCHHDAHIEIIGFQPATIQAALNLYGARLDKGWSLTDCFSFVVIQERGIRDALTGDHHFAQAGFRALLLQEPAG
jgi:predicted nucleic acid-binding protein